MKLSIIIPVYRTEATLDRCLKSITRQSFRDLEIILVDDGSPDRCPQLCDQWAQRDSRIIVIHRENGGLSAARNTGIERAQGDFITFVDSDDYMGEGTLEQLMPIAEGCDLLEYPIWQYYGSKRQKYLKLEQRSYTSGNEYWTATSAYLHTYACNKIFRSWLFDNLRFPEGKVFEDVYILPRLLQLSPRIMTTNRGTYYYCDNTQGITATATGNELRMLLEAYLTADMPMDDQYYLHLLNIQMDVCELTGDAPRLPIRRIRPAGTLKQRLKAMALNTFGINGICKISKLIHYIKKPSRS